jgi:hypothetical protein
VPPFPSEEPELAPPALGFVAVEPVDDWVGLFSSLEEQPTEDTTEITNRIEANPAGRMVSILALKTSTTRLGFPFA